MFLLDKIFDAVKFVMSTLIRYTFAVREFVYAKLRGSPPWPAQIEEVQNNYARVRFLADNDRW